MTELIESETKDATVVVSRVVSHPPKSVWTALLSSAGMAALLGEGGQLGDKGDSWRAADGTYGVTRSFHAMEQIRFSWHKNEDSPRTLVDVHLTAQGDDTLIEIRHEHVGTDLDPAQLKAHWAAALDRIATDAL